MKLFEKAFYRKINEYNLAGAGGVFGDTDSMGHGGAVGNTDFYNTGSTVIPQGPKKKKKSKGKNKSKSRDIGVNMLAPVQRRPLNQDM